MVILDGLGERAETEGNAVALAHTPALDYLRRQGPFCTLAAHGPSVGLPTLGDMGNSEVGHNAIGSGQIYDQGAKRVQDALASGEIFQGSTWKDLIHHVKKNQSVLHFIGLLSDALVHSSEDHLYALMTQAKLEGIDPIRIHPLSDGRDVPEGSGTIYAQRLEALCQKLGGDIWVASGGGRMAITMDRYGADWAMVERGWKAHVLGEAPNRFGSLTQAMEALGPSDQHRPPFTIVPPTPDKRGTIEDGDGVVFFNFRGDRGIQISQAFEKEHFPHFDRKRTPKVFFAGMMEYDGDEKIPSRFLVPPPKIRDTLGEYLGGQGIRQFACSETQKYGHVTYFWNGNRSGYLYPDLEEYLEIPSDRVIFDEKPLMKAFEITRETIRRMEQKTFDFGRINFPNPDMVGHTGNLPASIAAVTWVDHMLTLLMEAAQRTGYTLLVTADHGNCEEMFQPGSQRIPGVLGAEPPPKTSHTLSPVPCAIYAPHRSGLGFRRDLQKPGLANLANTALDLMGIKNRDFYGPSLLA
jgi:2,3-bisphosphoglycerate-independent phosphoglycerate mutase